MKNIIFEIDKIKYLLFDAEIDISCAVKFLDAVKQNNGIIQSNRINQGGWITKSSILISALIPEENAVSFSNYQTK